VAEARGSFRRVKEDLAPTGATAETEELLGPPWLTSDSATVSSSTASSAGCGTPFPGRSVSGPHPLPFFLPGDSPTFCRRP
jgi:hypothetical protein